MQASVKPSNYVIPSATKWADSQLLRIYKQASCQERGSLISKKFLPDFTNITYGYLGNYARAFKTCKDSLASAAFSSTYILDHAYVPSSLKGNIFRLASADQDLSPIIFHASNLLSADEEKSIFAHLTDLQEMSEISFSIPNEQIIAASHSKKFSLFIKASAFLNCLFEPKLAGLYTRINALQQSKLGLPLLTSLKPLEVFVDECGETVSRKYSVTKVTARFNAIQCVYSPTSMMAIPFILHSIPVHLSPVHPLSGMLGCFVPALPPRVAFEMIYNCILKTSVSLFKFGELESYLSDLVF